MWVASYVKFFFKKLYLYKKGTSRIFILRYTHKKKTPNYRAWEPVEIKMQDQKLKKEDVYPLGFRALLEANFQIHPTIYLQFFFFILIPARLKEISLPAYEV